MNKKFNTSKIVMQFFVYLALIALAVVIAIPVAWVFMASLKENSEFYGRSPWTLPEGLNFQNFIDAFEKANMGTYGKLSVCNGAVPPFPLADCDSCSLRTGEISL